MRGGNGRGGDRLILKKLKLKVTCPMKKALLGPKRFAFWYKKKVYHVFNAQVIPPLSMTCPIESTGVTGESTTVSVTISLSKSSKKKGKRRERGR